MTGSRNAEPPAEFTLGPGSDAVPVARRFARAAMAGQSPGLVDDAELVVAELVTNATLHGEPPVTLRIITSANCVRVEVEDTGRTLPMKVLQRSDAMTGRGLSLVAAVSSRWGVERQLRGKTVWAELDTNPVFTVPGDIEDPDALLASPPDDDRTTARYTVHIGPVPTAFLLSAKAQVDNVVREFALLQQGSQSTGQPLPEAVDRLVRAVTMDFSEARTEIKRQALAAAASGEMITEVELHLPLEAADAGERYLAALDEADRYARSSRLLTLAAPNSHRVLRRWYVHSLAEQLRAMANGEQPLEPEPLAVVLADEVDRLSQLEDLALVLDLVQKLQETLAVAVTAESMASQVVEAASQYPGVESARVYLLEGHATLRSVAWHTAQPRDPNLYAEIPIDADLPGAEVARTRRPLVMKSLREVYSRFPDMEGYYPSERSLHIVPVTIGDETSGVLGLTFRGGELGQENEVRFVNALSGALAQALARLS